MKRPALCTGTLCKNPASQEYVTKSPAGLLLVMAAIVVLPSACRDAENTSAADAPHVEVKASVAPFDAITISSPIDGTVADLNAHEGTVVHQGDVLATLTNAAVERDIAYANAAVLAAEHKLRGPVSAPAAAPRRNREREQFADDLVRQRQARADRLRALLKSGDVARQDVENAEAELSAARRDAEAERQQVAPAAAAAQVDMSLLQAELERARADQKFAEKRRSQLVIKAPATGTLMRLRIAVGSDIYPRDPLGEIVDGSTARVQALLAPELLRFTQVGRPVDVRLMTIPPRRFREPIARVVQPGAEGGPAIIVNIPNPDRMLQPGTPAVITIQ